MNRTIVFERGSASEYISEEEMKKIGKEADAARETLTGKTGAGSEYTGWVDLPVEYDREELERIRKAAERIRKDSEVFVCIGIGGSYLGARAAIEACSHSFYTKKPDGPEVYFAGNSISSTYLADLLEVIGDRDISVNVISKSGTTTEPAIAFRVFRELLEKKYGREEAAKRIYATTDRKKGALKTLADEEGYETFVVPDDIGGRYSVLTAVGLLPIAVAGLDVDAMLSGAADMREFLLAAPPDANPALQYASVRNLLYRQGKTVEILADYEPGLHYVAEWWKQLFGESEGKDGKGIYPASVDLTTDLHSMGQFIQDGNRIIFETVINVEKARKEMTVKPDSADLDGLNYLAGKTVDQVNHSAMSGTIMAHASGGVPVFTVNVPELTEYYLGQLFYFFEFSCGVSGYMLGINPFNQPGVESYKKNMFMLLGKPGYR